MNGALGALSPEDDDEPVVDVLSGDPAIASTLDGRGWLVDLSDRRTASRRIAESIAALSDGLVGTRGNLEEDGEGSAPGVMVAGAYVPDDLTGQAAMALPSWALLGFRRRIEPGTRVLDLREGVLWRAVRDGTADDELLLHSARWACLARPGTEVLVVDAAADVLDPSDQGPSSHANVHSSRVGPAVSEVGDDRWQPADGRVRLFRVTDYRLRSVGGAGPSLGTRHGEAVEAGPVRLLAEQRAAWRDRWRHADVEIVGDEDLTRALRLAVFHIHAAAADCGEAVVGARGLTGTSYAGHVFWDAEIFVLPVLAFTHPSSAMAMLRYRLDRLTAALVNADRSGRSGARFPWESAADGTDVTPTSGVDELGHRVPILTGALEDHITADVAWAAFHVASVLGDRHVLHHELRPLVIETARYWASRIRVDDSGTGHIDGVIGPDEYHENVDDNAYTNAMAAWNLRLAATLSDELLADESSASEQAGAIEGEARVDEPGRWRRLADCLVTGYDPVTGRHEQFAGYDRLEPLLVDVLGSVPVAADVVLGRDRLARCQIVKQADVLMLHHLVPDAMPEGSFARDLDWYLPRTAHGSTLSPAVHASLLARAGRMDEALHWLHVAAAVDTEDLTGTTAGGMHMAALGGLWQAVVFGFAGLRVEGPGAPLALDPHVPAQWDELRLNIEWRGAPVALRCRPNAVHVACDAQVEIVLDGRLHVVGAPGGWLARH